MRIVAGGGVYLMSDITQQLARVNVVPLTRREREVALLLFTFGLRMSILQQSPHRFWPVILSADLLLMVLLADQFA